MHRGEPATKVVMSEEAELRECNEVFESEEGDVDPFLEDDEGDDEETESSRELMERLRELEAENSSLALANESQREAYERCLDEVANHVVQALLNQKDLREECIKLKMRVFDLERQNRMLTELFTQKLHTHPNPLQQLPSVTLAEHNLDAAVASAEKMVASHCQGDAKSTGDRTQSGTPSQTRGPPSSMEALSPFFKKKAHILEVLRKLEEADPLKFHPSSCLSSYHDVGQSASSLFPGELAGTSAPMSRAPHCRHSSSDSDIHEYASVEGMLLDDRGGRGHPSGCPSCRLLNQKSSLDSLLRGATGHSCSFVPTPVPVLPVREEDIAGGQVWVESHQQVAITNAHVGSGVGGCGGGSGVTLLESTSHSYAHGSTRMLDGRTVVGGSSAEASDQHQEEGSGDTAGSVQRHKEKAAEKLLLRKSLSRGSDNTNQGDNAIQAERPPQLQGLEQSQVSSRTEQESCYMVVDTGVTVGDKEGESSEKVCNGVLFSSNETSVSKKVAVESYSPAPVPERTSSISQPQTQQPQVQQQSSGKSKFALSPTSPPSCLSEAKTAPMASPSRLLKFLKIPAIGDRPQTQAQALRLSPQLTRSSKIPCRNNNYEVYHSPVMPRKATTTERDKASSSSSSISSTKTDTYPSTHSAPTSPPKPDENLCIPAAPKPGRAQKGPAYASSQPQRNSQKVPHYENVSELATSSPAPQYSPYIQRDGGTLEKQQAGECDDKHSPASKTSDSSPATGDSPSESSDEEDEEDEETDTDSPVWNREHQHFSLPSSSSSASSKTQRVSMYSSMKDRPSERAVPEVQQQPQVAEVVPLTASNRRGDQPPSLPKRTVSAKPQSETSHHPFKERLAALGKLKSNEDLQQSTVDKKEAQISTGRAPTTSNTERSKTAERQGDRNVVEHRHTKYTDSLDGKPYPKTSLAGYAKYPSACQEASPKSSATSGSSGKGEVEGYPPRVYVTKSEGPKIKMGMASTTESPVVMRSYGKCQVPPNHQSKTSPSPQSSPTKAPTKSPAKASSYPRGMKPAYDERSQAQAQAQTQRQHAPRPDDKSKLTASKKKFVHAESFPPPPPPRPPVETSVSTQSLDDKKPLAAAPSGPQSAIEQKVMRGIEENMLKLQEQDRHQAVETKQKTSNGIANWFGLKKSKLPALSRKPEMSKLRLNMSSTSSTSTVGSTTAGKESKAGPRKVVESLNISKLMEKAEDLRKALEEERAYVNGVGVPLDRSGRGHSCEVVMDPTQGQLSLMYRGVTADNFMQQLLNRVDEKGNPSFGIAHRRLSFDSKRSQASFLHQRNGMSHTKSRDEIDKGPTMVGRDEVISDENLAESMSSQHFTGSGASMRTLDSGIGTFPLPDYASSAADKGSPKARPTHGQDQAFLASQGRHGPLMKVPRKARTLDRELSSLDEVNPSLLYSGGGGGVGRGGSGEGGGVGHEGKGPSMHLSTTIHEDIDTYGAHMQTPPSKNWTFPNLKGSAGSTDVYLGVQAELEPSGPGTPSRRKQGGPQGPRDVEPGALPLAPQMGMSRRGKSRIPGGPDVSKEGGLELVKERPDDILSPSRPQALETPESLSDSLYDSLSSCGSQG